MDRSAFRRELSLLDLAMASLGGIIGSGWLFGPLRAASFAGPAAVISWVIGGSAVILIALVYSELSALVPEAGGLVRFPQYSHGTMVSLLMGWSAWITYAAVASIEAEAVVQYANHYLPGLFDVANDVLTPAGLIVAALLLGAFFLLNYVGVGTFARANAVITSLKLIVPTLTVGVLLALEFHPANFTAAGGFLPGGTAGVLSAVSSAGIIFAFLGFRQAIDLAGEARQPRRDVPRAVILALGITSVLYVLLQVAFIAAVPAHFLARGWHALSLSAPYVDVANAWGLGWLALLLLVDAAISPAGTGLVYTGTNARVVYALTRNGYFPEWLGHLNPRYRVPDSALIVNLIIGLIFLIPFPSWSRLVGVVTSGVALTYVAGPVAAMALRRTAAHAYRPVRIAGLRIIAPLAFVVSGLIIYWSGWPTVGEVMLLALVGLILYAYYYPRRHFDPSHVRAGLWVLGYEIFLAAISYLGSFGGIGVVPYGIDQVVVVAGSLIAYDAGVRSAVVTREARSLPTTPPARTPRRPVVPERDGE